VTIYESAPGPAEFGAGLQITPNGARVLEAFGLGPVLDDISVRALAVVPFDALSGRAVARFDLRNPVPPYRFMFRVDLARCLTMACQAAGVDIRYATPVTSHAPDGAFQTPQGRGHADLVVGAEGLRSQARLFCGNTGAAAFTGQVAWRAVIDAPGATPEAWIWMAPGRHIVTYPLKDGGLNIVAVQERSGWAAEGWNHADDPANLRAAFDDCCPAIREMLSCVREPRLWGLFRHEVAQHWYLGRLAILGDAAHPTLPFLAQGANLAIEDAWVLAACCDEAAVLGEGLARYQRLRRDRVCRTIAAANANARNYHLSGLRRRAAHAGLRSLSKVAPHAFLARMDWLYGHDVTG
jgi:salicylate hydroxylase